MVEIQHGCTLEPNKENTYRYTEVSVKATNRDYQTIIDINSNITQYIFVAAEGLKPEIGDFIVNGTLEKRTTPKVNNDWRKWKDKDL